jgi:hypothetical protein
MVAALPGAQLPDRVPRLAGDSVEGRQVLPRPAVGRVEAQVILEIGSGAPHPIQLALEEGNPSRDHGVGIIHVHVPHSQAPRVAALSLQAVAHRLQPISLTMQNLHVKLRLLHWGLEHV